MLKSNAKSKGTYEIYRKQTVCFVCINYQKNFKCKAFPDGIPNIYMSGDKNHNNVDRTQIGDFTYTLKN